MDVGRIFPDLTQTPPQPKIATSPAAIAQGTSQSTGVYSPNFFPGANPFASDGYPTALSFNPIANTVYNSGILSATTAVALASVFTPSQAGVYRFGGSIWVQGTGTANGTAFVNLNVQQSGAAVSTTQQFVMAAILCTTAAPLPSPTATACFQAPLVSLASGSAASISLSGNAANATLNYQVIAERVA